MDCCNGLNSEYGYKKIMEQAVNVLPPVRTCYGPVFLLFQCDGTFQSCTKLNVKKILIEVSWHNVMCV